MKKAFHTDLTEVLHAIRNELPETEVAEQARIQLYQLKKYRNGVRLCPVEHARQIIRLVNEHHPEGAERLACEVLPRELFTAVRVNPNTKKIGTEIHEITAALGEFTQRYLDAIEDCHIDAAEVETLVTFGRQVMQQANDLISASLNIGNKASQNGKSNINTMSTSPLTVG